MPHLTTDDGVKLFYEEVGAGAPIVFVHEFAGDWRSWSTSFAISGGAIAASPSTRAAFLRRTFPTASRAIRRSAPATTSSPCSTP